MDTTATTTERNLSNPAAPALGMDENAAQQLPPDVNSTLPPADPTLESSDDNSEETQPPSDPATTMQNTQLATTENKQLSAKNGPNNPPKPPTNQPKNRQKPPPLTPRRGELVLFCPYHPKMRLESFRTDGPFTRYKCPDPTCTYTHKHPRNDIHRIAQRMAQDQINVSPRP